MYIMEWTEIKLFFATTEYTVLLIWKSAIVQVNSDNFTTFYIFPRR